MQENRSRISSTDGRYFRSRRHDMDPSPLHEIATTYALRATQAAAVAAALRIQQFTGGREEMGKLEDTEKKRRVKAIDTCADTAFQSVLNTAPLLFYGIDAEGGKEACADKLGEAMPLAIGIFGTGKDKVSFAVDVVEGTTAAAHGRPDAMSIMGLTDYEGLTKIPVNSLTGTDVHYFRKLFASPEFRNELSLDNSTTENLHNMMRHAGIPANAITVAVMDRKCNASIINEAQEVGANIALVSAGDLAWCLRAVNSNPEHPIIMLGRGGAEEGSIAAVAARALGATCQLRVIEEPKDVEIVDRTHIWTADEFVPSAREHATVLASFITPNTHFGSPGVQLHGDNATVHSLRIDATGYHYRTNVVDLGTLGHSNSHHAL